MKTVSRGCLAVAAVAVSMLLLNVPARVDAETKITIIPAWKFCRAQRYAKSVSLKHG
jgi:metal-sulfur cluster biosynthetic enzyme